MNKKQQLIEGATALFYEKGIHAVGINEVLKSTGIAKKTLYSHFASKEDLVLACLQYRHTRFVEWFAKPLMQSENIKQAIVNAFLALHDWFTNKVTQLGEFRGCFFINASAEFSNPNTPVNQLCCDHKNHIKTLFANCLKSSISDNSRVNKLSQQLCILKEGCISDARVRHNLNAPIEIIPVVKMLLQGCVDGDNAAKT